MLDRFVNFESLFSAFSDAGFTLFIVGGCVRDAVMGATDLGDVDLATDALPEDTKRVLVEAGFKAFPIGERFGTITTIVAGATVEITTFRVDEAYETHSRHPVVRFGDDLRADLSRRDLSINAMAMDRDGAIIDPFEGQRAIEERILEVPGGGYERTISILQDDPLRLLRIARFAARFGFEPTSATTDAATATAPSLADISRERWKMEMDKLLVGPALPTGLRWLHRVGALAVVMPETQQMSPEAIDRVAARLMSVGREAVTRWAILLLSALHLSPWTRSSSAPPSIEVRGSAAAEVARRFRFSNAERKRLALLCTELVDCDSNRATPSLPWLRRLVVAAPDAIEARLDVAEALADDDREATSRVADLRRSVAELLAHEDPVPRLPRGLGDALRRQLSLRGAEIGDAVREIEEAILDGRVENGADALTYVAYLESRTLA